jgi:hypothetical protein
MRSRLLPLAAAIVAAAGLTGCAGSSTSSTGSQTTPAASPHSTAVATPAPSGPAAELAGKDAAAVVAWLKAHDVPVAVTTIYDENTDPNNLLGRPGGYSSKAAFQDARVPADKYGSEADDPNRGGSVEVFAAQKDAVTRARDVQGKLKTFGLGTEYDYVVGGVLVRVTGTVAPTQAASYQIALAVAPQPAS